jgi:hypothetical protein
VSESPPQKPSASQHWTWTASQRRVLLGILACLIVCLSVRYACNPVYVSDPQPEVPSRFDELADRIDPNTADWETLAALPGIGEKRAKDIVAYRDRAAGEHPGKPVFEKQTDLLKIRGVGRAMMEGMEPYLSFPSAPSTQP